MKPVINEMFFYAVSYAAATTADTAAVLYSSAVTTMQCQIGKQ